jgi:hypothetical protein
VWELQELPDRLNKIDENDGGGAPMVRIPVLNFML